MFNFQSIVGGCENLTLIFCVGPVASAIRSTRNQRRFNTQLHPLNAQLHLLNTQLLPLNAQLHLLNTQLHPLNAGG